MAGSQPLHDAERETQIPPSSLRDMSRLSAPALATGVAIAMLIGMGLATAPSITSAEPRMATLPVEVSSAIPEGRCQIQYESLPATHQPAHMECGTRRWLARAWGGRVMVQRAGGMAELARYEGANDFTGVPTDALPRAGRCRAWLDGLSPAAQPAESDCRSARRTAAEHGGRVLFMPL